MSTVLAVGEGVDTKGNMMIINPTLVTQCVFECVFPLPNLCWRITESRIPSHLIHGVQWLTHICQPVY